MFSEQHWNDADEDEREFLRDFVDDENDNDDSASAIASRLRVRRGNRWTPSFHDLVDVGCDVVRMSRSGETTWQKSREGEIADLCDDDYVSVRVSYRGDAVTDSTASTVWDSAVFLAKTIFCEPALFSRDANDLLVIELGAGTGLAGLAVAKFCQRRAILTDLPTAVPQLNRNIEVNNLQNLVTSMSLEWGQSSLPDSLSAAMEGKNVCVICADCLLPYAAHLLEALALTLSLLVRPDSTDQILLAYERRFDVSEFVDVLLPKHHLSWELLKTADCESLHLIRIERTRDSVASSI